MTGPSYLQRFGDVELAVSSRGNGIPFVWGHSLMGSIRVENKAALWDWKRVERHARVVRYDARGHGNSDGSYQKEDYRWDRLATDMLAIGDAYATADSGGRYLLGGISMGAATALEAAVQKPGRVAGLVLVLPPTAWDTRPRQAAIYRRMAWVSGLFGAAPYRLLNLLPVPVREDGRYRLSINTMRGLAQANPLLVQAAVGGAAMSDLSDPQSLRKLRVPTLILAWEGDTAHPVSTAEVLANTLPDVRDLVVCDPADIGEWEVALVEFVQQVAASAAAQSGRTGKSVKAGKGSSTATQRARKAS